MDWLRSLEERGETEKKSRFRVPYAKPFSLHESQRGKMVLQPGGRSGLPRGGGVGAGPAQYQQVVMVAPPPSPLV
jgi:hypothetical protein